MQKVIHILFSVVVLHSISALAAAPKSSSTSSGGAFGGGLKFNVGYGALGSSPKQLNNYRSNTSWNSTTPTEGTFNTLFGFNGGLGYCIGGTGFLNLEYGSYSKVLGITSIAGISHYTIQDKLNVDTAYLIYDQGLIMSGDWAWTLGFGVGGAPRFEYHQTIIGGAGEDITWVGKPMGGKVRTTILYAFLNHVALTLQIEYESLSSVLNANKAYTTSPNGLAIAKDQGLKDSAGADVRLDLSGARGNLGLTLLF